MNVSEIFIRKPIMTTLSTVMIVVAGIACYFQLPISSLPNVDYPVIQISAAYPGASPSTMASAVATPLEAECMQINGITSIISDNGPGIERDKIEEIFEPFTSGKGQGGTGLGLAVARKIIR